jgi:DNA-binding response OmpR family regulator
MTTQVRHDIDPATLQLLIVEDDLNLGFLLLDYLQEEGFKAKLCRDGIGGLEQFRKKHYDLCLLDVMMPKMDGFELAERMREENPDARFLFLTARSMKSDKVQGYELGAEDYMTKPFDQDELLYKIKAILRRCSATPQEDTCIHQIGEYVYDPTIQELTIHERTIRLTEKENAVLNLLSQNREKILRRDDAVEIIYGKRDYFLGRSFDVFISRIRKHLRHDPRVNIENVYKVGFILTVDAG